MASSSSFLATLLVLSAALAILAPTCSASSYLLTGDVLYSDWSLEYGDYRLTMQADCNLVLYDHDSPVWSSKTYKKGDHSCRLDMQDDGNLVIYNTALMAPIWASDSSRGRGGGKYVLVLQPDRNVVIYGGAIWSAGSTTKAAVAAADETITMVNRK
jgi:hypothetical protein